MEIEINGKKYEFRVTGTVGLVYLAERMLGEGLKDGDRYHTLVLFYCCLQASNRDKELPDLIEFIASITTKTMAEMSTYFWSEWKRLEPEAPVEDAKGED